MTKKTIAILVLSGSLLLGIGTAHADEPTPGITTPVPPSTTTTVAPTTTTTSTTVAPAPAPEPTPEAARARMAELVNRARAAHGLPPLAPRADVTDIAMRWSESMARAGGLSHNDAYFAAETRRRLDAKALGENVARAGTIEQAHDALMASEHHRANILDARFDVIGLGAVYEHGSWWVTEDFLQSRGAPAAAPVAAPDAARAAPAAAAPRTRSAARPQPVTTLELGRTRDIADVLAAAPAEPAAVAPSSSTPRVSRLASEELAGRPSWVAALAAALGLVVFAGCGRLGRASVRTASRAAHGEARFGPESSSAREARGFVRDALAAFTGPQPVLHDCVLLVSELVTNAIEHARTSFVVRWSTLDQLIRIEVEDDCPDLPVLVEPPSDEPRGRGLSLVRALSADWGIEPTVAGKVVWFEMTTASSAARA